MTSQEWVRQHFAVDTNGNIQVAILPGGHALMMPADFFEAYLAPVVQQALDAGQDVFTALKNATYQIRVTREDGTEEIVSRTLAELGWEQYFEAKLTRA